MVAPPLPADTTIIREFFPYGHPFPCGKAKSKRRFNLTLRWSFFHFSFNSRLCSATSQKLNVSSPGTILSYLEQLVNSTNIHRFLQLLLQCWAFQIVFLLCNDLSQVFSKNASSRSEASVPHEVWVQSMALCIGFPFCWRKSLDCYGVPQSPMGRALLPYLMASHVLHSTTPALFWGQWPPSVPQTGSLFPLRTFTLPFPGTHFSQVLAWFSSLSFDSL